MIGAHGGRGQDTLCNIKIDTDIIQTGVLRNMIAGFLLQGGYGKQNGRDTSLFISNHGANQKRKREVAF